MENKIVFNGRGAVFGRLSTNVAKELLKGSFVDVINCEDIIVSGDKRKFADRISQKRNMGRGGSLKGPKYIREADMLVKRMIRGMLPWDTSRGRDAYKRLKCYVGDNGIKDAIELGHKLPSKYSTIKQIVSLLK